MKENQKTWKGVRIFANLFLHNFYSKKIDFDLSFAFFLLVNYLMTDCLVVDLSFAEKIFEFLFKFKRKLILYNLLFDKF
jgi:hypothetical protein